MSRSASGQTDAGYTAAVDGWAAHLRGGGATPWETWRETGPRQVEPVRGTPLPDSVHLELIRRINQQAAAPVPGLADLVLATPSPGRGRVDVPLPWPPHSPQPPRFGSPPIDPANLPDDELVRLAVGVLARLLPLVPAPQAPPELTRWPVPWRRRFRLHGSPGTVAAVRAGLFAQGFVETDWRPVHVVLGRPLEVMMAEHWADATARGAHARWTTVWRRAQATEALPARLDVVAIAERLASAPGRRRDPVHLVVAREAGEVATTVARLLRARSFDPGRGPDAAHVDLLRRLNRHTGITPGGAQVRRLAATLAAVLDETSTRAPVPVPPRAALAWAHRTAARAAERATRPDQAGYAVHGDPRGLVPLEPSQRAGQPGTIDPRHTLEVAVEACVRAWTDRRGEHP